MSISQSMMAIERSLSFCLSYSGNYPTTLAMQNTKERSTGRRDLIFNWCVGDVRINIGLRQIGNRPAHLIGFEHFSRSNVEFNSPRFWIAFSHQLSSIHNLDSQGFR